ncbi:pollen-specific leucine-rich repeat extensin-like protein 3 [Dioscorea cayenensis subsp. rotundata]|uniref:Pollen-specific leucine-rich repeat extensin-like protein 3 n=1 Tax=Dioscorea cayennensis subsp. rotundata TaxID=55577 RepID=A0AB40CGN2_DIOCR|nr:pollen-specific leucine-rich repeat extensin-like protein 3 [Dioscorea cayenensis subsp. rotundata]
MDSSFPPLSLHLYTPETHSQPPPPPAQPQPHFSSTLHSIKKPPVKSWRRSEQPPPRVYRVEPRGFRKLVQRLTGAPPKQAGSRPLRDTAPMPAPLELAPRPLPQPVQSQVELGPGPLLDNNGFMGFNISQPFYSGWCLSPLLSPGTLSALDHGSSPVL